MTAKSCHNCGVESCHDLDTQVMKGICERWQRNPRLWLDIVPEQEGWYIYRKYKNKWKVAAVYVNNEGKLFWKSNNHIVSGEYEWQGPITPEGE